MEQTSSHRAGLRARIVAASLEVSHLKEIATHPTTLGELADVLRLLEDADRRLVKGTDLHAIDEADGILTAAVHRLRMVHAAIAGGGRGAAM